LTSRPVVMAITPGGQDTLCGAEARLIKRKEKLVGVIHPKYKAGQAMARRELPPQKLQEIRELAARWGQIVAQRACGDAGSAGLDFQAMEELAAAAAAGVTEGTLSALLQQQTQALPVELPCPKCGRLCPVGHESRPLTVRAGQTIPLTEPVCHCPDCRRDFFPPADLPAPG
jgi:hypothetical protein